MNRIDALSLKFQDETSGCFAFSRSGAKTNLSAKCRSPFPHMQNRLGRGADHPVTQPRLAFLGMLAGYLFPGSTAGFLILPTNKSAPLRLSRIIKIKGWSAINMGDIDTMAIPTPVAAAASVPSSFTSTKAL